MSVLAALQKCFNGHEKIIQNTEYTVATPTLACIVKKN